MSRKRTSAAQPKPDAPAATVTEAPTATQAQAQADAVAEAVLSTVHEAVGAAQTESTLGDGDATGAAQEAPQATAAPQAPAPSVVKPAAKAAGHVLRVLGPAKGRWRAGRKFGPEPVDIPVAELTEDDLAKLEGDPELTVALVPIEA